MPDVWTSNPKKFRNTLIELGADCGKESRVLKPRDPEWTCHVDGNGWLRDVYIHPVQDLIWHKYFFSALTLALIVGIFLGLGWGKRFWQEKH